MSSAFTWPYRRYFKYFQCFFLFNTTSKQQQCCTLSSAYNTAERVTERCEKKKLGYESFLLSTFHSHDRAGLKFVIGSFPVAYAVVVRQLFGLVGFLKIFISRPVHLSRAEPFFSHIHIFLLRRATQFAKGQMFTGELKVFLGWLYVGTYTRLRRTLPTWDLSLQNFYPILFAEHILRVLNSNWGGATFSKYRLGERVNLYTWYLT